MGYLSCRTDDDEEGQDDVESNREVQLGEELLGGLDESLVVPSSLPEGDS